MSVPAKDIEVYGQRALPSANVVIQRLDCQ